MKQFVLLLTSFFFLSNTFSQTPVASISVSKIDGISPTTLTFDGSQSISPGSTIVSYEWDFGEGSTSTSPTGTFTYDTVGTFPLQLIVEDGAGARDTTSFLFSSYGPGTWDMLGGNPDKRLENGYVEVGTQFIMIGGIKTGGNGFSTHSILAYDPIADTWTEIGVAPQSFHHFQPVVKDGLIYILSAWTTPNPFNDSNDSIYIYNPLTDDWTTGREVPPTRKRGSAGCVLFEDKMYIACGNEGGHGGHSDVKVWLDVYDPATGAWDSLADAPIARDHVYATVLNDELYVAAGRQSNNNSWLTTTILQNDVYSFDTNTWQTVGPNLPTGRSGAPILTLDDKLVVIGGETDQNDAHEEMEVYDPVTNKWIRYTDMDPSSHGTNAIVNNNMIWVAGGSEKKGVSNQDSDHKFFYSNGTSTPDLPILTPVTQSTLQSDSTVNFSGTVVGDSAYAEIVVRSASGNQGIVLTEFLLNGDSSLLEILHPFVMPIVVAPGDSAVFQVRYVPAGNVAPTGNVQIVHKGLNDTIAVSFGEVAPLASLQVSNTGSPDSYMFDGSLSSDLDGSIVSYSWNFGDGSLASGPTQNHIFSTNGTYIVQLIVTDNAGLTDTISQSIVVSSSFPIELTDFSAKAELQQVDFYWTTLFEQNSDYFVLEEVLTTTKNIPLGVIAAAGESVLPLSYSFKLDAVPPGRHIYQLVSVDQDGSRSYSRQIQLEVSAHPFSLNVYPNPVTEETRLEIVLDKSMFLDLSLCALNGQHIRYLYQGDLPAGKHQMTEDFSGLPPGAYLIRTGTSTLVEIIKN